MEYITTSLVTADIYIDVPRHPRTPSKWENLCCQINILSKKDLDSGRVFQHQQPPIHSRTGIGNRSASLENKTPTELKHLESRFGWQECENGNHYIVVREPKIARVQADAQFNVRSTWIKQLEGWSQIENYVNLDKMSNSKDRIKV